MFQEYFTNTRHTLTQESEADVLALKVVVECGFRGLTPDRYKQVLRIIDNKQKNVRGGVVKEK